MSASFEFLTLVMDGSGIEDGWEFASPSNGFRTLVLIGRTGNGKSATGNTILGKTAFKSRAGPAVVTKTCELRRTILNDGQIVNVIDTPGLFNSSLGSGFSAQEIVKCLDLAEDGIHAVIVVLSVGNRSSPEEEAVLCSLQNLFGRNIINYMIAVFTGGDDLENNEETFEDYLDRECPEPLKKFLSLLENRAVLFDNKTKDESKKIEEVKKLLLLVNTVVAQNGGEPYNDGLFADMREVRKFCDQQLEDDLINSKGDILMLKAMIEKSYEEQLRLITEMVESRLRETMTKLEQQLAEEKAARLEAEEMTYFAKMESEDEIQKLHEDLKRAQSEMEELLYWFKAEEMAHSAQMKSDDEIQKLHEDLERAQRETEELRSKGQCNILCPICFISEALVEAFELRWRSLNL